MHISSQQPKKVYELTIDDFTQFPIWTWADEDEDTVIPEDTQEVLPDEDNSALFVHSELRLNDGTSMVGILSVATSNHWVYVIEFVQTDGKLLSLSLQPQLAGFSEREQVASHLGNTTEQVFPIKYRTPFAFSDGQPLIGQIG